MSGKLGMRGQVATPALILDLDAMDRNIATMLRRAETMGVTVRPHAKSHKCAEIARRLKAAGAIGACCATIGEAEALAAGGIDGLLITSPMSTPDLIARVERMLRRGADLMLVVDDPANIAPLADLARAAGRTLPLIVGLDVGVSRTGCRTIEGAAALAQMIAAVPSLRFAGVQAYWGNLQQVMPFAERESRVAVQAERLRQLIEALRRVGLAPGIVTGAGTGTYAIDGTLGLFTELQPGSFLFLDSCYGAIPLGRDGNPFESSLFVAASVISANDADRAIVDAGWKAFATDSGLPKPMRGAPQGATYRYMGDEHGAIENLDEPLSIGDRVELQVSHCDPTVNLHSAFMVVQGDAVTDVWPVVARGYGGNT
jgi:3-hydroxy-D-aspartate aldolase